MTKRALKTFPAGVRRVIQGVAALMVILVALAMMPGGYAQDAFPNRPFTFVVPFSPGSGTDNSARVIAENFAKLAGQPVVVENRPGANGFIAVQQVLKAPADGHTIFVGSNSTLAVNAALFKDLPYDPVADFTPIAGVVRGPVVLIVPGNSPYKTLDELVQAARANPDKMNFAGGSAGYQLMGELFNEIAQIDTTHVPYKGAPEAVLAVASGQVDFAVVDVSASLELIRAGRVNALIAAADKRLDNLPDVPTSAEAGLPDYTPYTWVAAMVSSKTPQPVADKLSGLFEQVLNNSRSHEFFANLNLLPMATDPKVLGEFQKEEVALWKRIAQKAGVELR